MDTSNKRIVIATHSLVYGASQALRDYILENKMELLFIEHPLFGNPITWAFGLIDTTWQVFRQNKTYHLYVGVDPLNAIVGVLLKRTGKVKKLVYYTIDYVPVRFNNSILNALYHYLDKVCLSYSDETWNVSPRIAKARETYRNLKQSVYKNQKVVPIGIWYKKIKRLPFEKINKHQLFFIGHLMEPAGVQLVIETIPKIIKEISDFHFLVVGGGEYETELRKLVKKMKLEKYVTFTGWIKERNKLDSIMMDSAAAVALYDKNTSTTTFFSDPTKLKDYLSAGLPIILTNLPHNAHDIEKNECGIIVDYDQDQVYTAIIYLMKDMNKLEKYRNNALQYAQKFDWNEIFNKNLLPLLK